MKPSSICAVILILALLAPARLNSAHATYETGAPVVAETEIDKIVFAKLRAAGIQPANLSSDAVFVRRAYLDVIGTLPTSAEAKTFLLSRDPNKRRQLIDKLLEREEFADYWAMKWSDLLRVKAEFPINLWPNAAQAYHRWIRTSIQENKPYDQFARELLTSSGSNFRVPQVNFYRAVQNREPRGLAQAVALTLMGTRTEKWPQEQLDGMAVFFSRIGYKSTAEWKEEIIFFDSTVSNDLAQVSAIFPDGSPAHLSNDRDPREVFADWLLQKENSWFARNMVNRSWSWFLGRGIIHEPDDIRADNPPSNPKLLSHLEREFVASGYDVKKLFRTILNSKTYQLSSLPTNAESHKEGDFASYPLRRLEAEVLIDALCRITGSTERYSSPIPEPFTYIPEDQRSIALPDGSITSSFLELFGRPSRDTGLESERNNRVTAGQRLHLLNSSHIQKKIEQSRLLQSIMQTKAPPRETIISIYLTILSRFPTEQEVSVITEQSHGLKARDLAVDLIWALLNNPEFLYRH